MFKFDAYSMCVIVEDIGMMMQKVYETTNFDPSP